ncbi:histone-lysine N-methyltransferase, H3 lysine-9 specific SUVH5-like [Telopea speciosissima]|uniref:histone-lysine N-methyltransferase, H3 lysine-9 specific SUVH5-like n=1 Tax=Telopea speciosissima TaxID=54955 RepID=UPI001CC512E9|nr:histone-lysine N-methyltransferase, H3 lysine-9 specific SUVH5-like [Telopea speciosissima]
MLINSSGDAELSGKRSLGNSIAAVPLKFKCRKVSIRRDFPNGCGQLVQRTGPGETAVANGSVEIVRNSVTTEGPALTKLAPISTPEPLKILVKAELSNSVETSKPKSAKLPEDLDRVISIKPMEVVEPLVKAFKPQTMKPFETSHQVESLETMKSGEQIPLLLPNAELLGMSSCPLTVNSLRLKLLRDSVLPDILEQPKTPNHSQLSFAVIKRSPKKCSPARRICATRDFPSGSMMNIQHVSEEVHLKSADIPKNVSINNENPLGESKETVRDKKSQELAVVNEEYLTWKDMPSEEKFREERSKESDTSLVTFGVQSSSDECNYEKVKETDMSEEMVSHKQSQELAVVNEGYAIGKDMTAEEMDRDQRSKELDVGLITFSVQPVSDKFIREKVKETLHMFQEIYKQFLHEERENKKDGRPMKPIYLLAANRLKKENKWVNAGKPIFGSVPGVEVGDEFHFRVELAIVGLHRTFQSGIDYTKVDGKILTISIVATGRYDADELDKSDVLVYSGEGGRPMGGHKQTEDQKLERGNLSLKNSMDAGSVVRVIRGFKQGKGPHYLDTKNKSFSKYIYDGLYFVEKYWQDMGLYGASVFKFQLRRIPGQPKLGWTELNKLKRSKEYEDTCVFDISQGKEKMCIRAVNTVDDEKPLPFIYTTKMIYSKWFNPAPHRGCDCTDGCLDSKRCLCAMKNGGEIPFNNDGAILEMKPLIYECGPFCKCPPSCCNRVSQHGIKFPLEIFKTKSSGWGVRSLTFIPCGSFICEYAGELLQDKEAEERTNNDEYLFDIGRNYDGPDLQMSSCEIIEDVGFTVDAAFYGNVGRFVNHSCSPNLYAQNVLYDHDDDKIPHIMLYAAENIPALQELAYDYNYKIDQVHDAEGNIKKKSCYCGSSSCTGRLY